MLVIAFAFLECVLCVVDFTCTNERLPSYQIFIPEKNFCNLDKFAVSEPAAQRKIVFNVGYAQPNEIREIHFEPYTVDAREPTSDDIAHVLPEIFSTFPNLSKLTVQTSLSELNPGDFTHALNLISLSLGNSDLKIIKVNVFSTHTNGTVKTPDMDAYAYPLHKLIRLLLFRSNIRDIEKNSFSGLNNLVSLVLSQNELTAIRRGMFSGLPSLRWLNLDNNKIETIEDGAFDLAALQELDLQKNVLKRLSDGIFDRMPQLRRIRLGQNVIEHIGQSLYRLPNTTTHIELQQNRIGDIDLAAFAQLSGLQHMDLTHSGFTFGTSKIDDDHQWNSPIIFLHIGNNNLSDANELNKLRIFPKLNYLDISENLFTDINVGNNRTLKDILPSLQIVSIAKNKISCESSLAIKNELEKHDIVVGRPRYFKQLQNDECEPETIL